ncbi:MAG: ATP-binding cassette domain-containing protein [Armatimonadetes bacterium]|nr:ATP-binding cassette domain-containing protein [Armatimonadota bacterium]
MIEASGLTRVFTDSQRGELIACRDVSFQCHPGRVYGLLGPNGAGKTTLLRMLSTLLRPTSGAARVNGYDILESPSQVRRSIGFLTGDTGVYLRLTPEEMVSSFGQMYGLGKPEIQKRMAEIFELLDMNPFRKVLCGKLSTGMRQKVNIARTLVHDPQVLLLDEATAGLDVVASRAIVDFVAHCKQSGKTVLFSTHIMSEAERICDEVFIMHQGQVLGHGTPQELREKSGMQTLEDVFLDLVGRQ